MEFLTVCVWFCHFSARECSFDLVLRQLQAFGRGRGKNGVTDCWMIVSSSSTTMIFSSLFGCYFSELENLH